MGNKATPNEQLLRRACELYKAASLQDHSGHFDPTGQSGLGCPECMDARKLRREADALMEQLHD